MNDQNNQLTLDQIAAQRHREIVANETIYNNEEERAKAMAAPGYPFYGNLKFKMPFPEATQVTGTLTLDGGTVLKVSGTVQGFGYTGEMSLTMASGFFSDDPDNLIQIPLTIGMKQAGRGIPQVEINIYNKSQRPAGVIMGGFVTLVPFNQLIGQIVLQKA